MDPDESLFALFDDLEQQALGQHLAERDLEVAELAAGEYAQVTLLGRLHAARGRPLQLRLAGGDRLSGRLVRVGADWLQLDLGHGAGCLVPLTAVTGVRGLGDRAVSDEALPVTARLSLRSALRALAAARRECLLQLAGGDRLEGRLGRVGQDFVEVHGPELSGSEAVSLAAVIAIRER